MQEDRAMSKDKKKLETEHATIYQTNENCQIFTGPVSGCVFAMPGATVNQYAAHSQQAPEGEENKGEVPEVLRTEEAEKYWQRLREAGFIAVEGYALAEGVSANQATYIADRMACQLGITNKWKVFQQLWGIKNMAQLAGSWQQSGKLPPKNKEIDKAFK